MIYLFVITIPNVRMFYVYSLVTHLHKTSIKSSFTELQLSSIQMRGMSRNSTVDPTRSRVTTEKRYHTACVHYREASRTLNAIITECGTFEDRNDSAVD